MKTRFLQVIIVIALFVSASFNLSASTVATPTQEKIKAVVAEITRNCHNDYEKAKAIYEWFLKNVKYDYELMKRIENDINSAYGEYKNPPKRVREEAERYVKQLNKNFLNLGEVAFEKQMGICSNLAHLYKLMCEEAGLKCKIVIGVAIGENGFSGHAWNIVEIYGNRHIVDVTMGITSEHHEIDELSKLFLQLLGLTGFDMIPENMIRYGYLPFHPEDQCLDKPFTKRQFANGLIELCGEDIPVSEKISFRRTFCKQVNYINSMYRDVSCNW